MIWVTCLICSQIRREQITIIPDLLEQGHDLEFNVTKEQVTAAAARWIVAVADTFTPPSLD